MRPAEHAEARHVRRLVAALEQPLHARGRCRAAACPSTAAPDRVAPRASSAAVAPKWPTPGTMRPRRAGAARRRRRDVKLGAERRERLAHRRQVAGAVVDERDHSSPFVLGSIFASRASFAQATRSARANALNTASMWWWLERP